MINFLYFIPENISGDKKLHSIQSIFQQEQIDDHPSISQQSIFHIYKRIYKTFTSE